ncbi:MAG: phospholipid carrier-dependent glycosyltransferase [Bacteroidota bacterium]
MKHLYLLLIILLALALRIPGAFWGQIDFPKYEVWEPDEFQHAEIAAQQIHALGTTLFPNRDFSKIWNTKAYGKQIGLIAFGLKQMDWIALRDSKLVFLGRFLSILYAVLLVLLTYHITKYLFQEVRIALLAALLLSIFDLNITYSHYAIPAISYVFWSHLSLYFVFLFHQKVAQLKLTDSLLFFLFLPLPFAMTLATKLDFLPIVVLGLSGLLLLFQRQLCFQKLLMLSIWFLVLGSFYYLLAHGFDWNFEEAKRSFIVTKDLNENVVTKDQRWLHNPVLYLLGIIGGTSLPIFILSMIGAINLMRSNTSPRVNPQVMALGWMVLLLFLEFLVRWQMDTPFIRRANIFLPFCAMTAAYALHNVLGNKASKMLLLRHLLVVFIIVYTLGLTLSSQRNFWRDNRYAARDFIAENIVGDAKIKYSMYAKIKYMPKETAQSLQDAEVLVLHETYYSRYWKSF